MASYLDRIHGHGPKRLLAVDGGGIRGVIALEVLDRLQEQLRTSTGRDGLVLSDVFDYIAGTSTGAIIAAGLSLGMSTGNLLRLYVEHGASMFHRSGWLDRLRHVYEAEPLEEMLKQVFGADTTFGSERLRTLLLVVLRNATTDSPWPLSNNPGARFNVGAPPGGVLDLPLWQLVRASTAAPALFEPEPITVGDEQHVFIDGGITPFNNPAFQLFTMATLDAYGLQWPTGEDRLLLVSVGTGNSELARPELHVEGMDVLYHATSTAGALMVSAAAQQDMLCRILGRCRWGLPIDKEVGTLAGTAGLIDEPLFTYVRYDVPLDRHALGRLGLDHLDLAEIRSIDAVDHIDAMREVGRAVADLAVDPIHLDGFVPTG